MLALLPSEVIGVSKDIVDEYLGSGVGTEIAWITGSARGAEVLRAESGCLLRVAGDSHDLIAAKTEDSAGIGRDAAVEPDASVVCREGIDDGWREGMHPVRVKEMIGVAAGARELDRNWIGGCAVLRVAL